MTRLKAHLGRTAAVVGLLFFGANGANAGGGSDTLTNLGTTIVSTEYAYPDGQEPGLLTISDDGLGLIASFLGAPDMLFSDIALTLSVELVGELGDDSDAFAHGQFGGGVLSITDFSIPGPGVTIFEADVLEFELVESQFNAGAYSGDGSFANATYGGGLSGVAFPTEGQLITSLFQWFTDSDLTSVVDIDTFTDAPSPEASNLYGEMTQVNVTPEPTSLALLAMAAATLARRRR